MLSALMALLSDGLPGAVRYLIAEVIRLGTESFGPDWLLTFLPPKAAAFLVAGDVLKAIELIPLIGDGLALINYMIPLEPIFSLWLSFFCAVAAIRLTRHLLGLIPTLNLG